MPIVITSKAGWMRSDGGRRGGGGSWGQRRGMKVKAHANKQKSFQIGRSAYAASNDLKRVNENFRG